MGRVGLADLCRRNQKKLDDGAWWISGNELENIWLGHVFPQGHPHLLAPPPEAILKTVKPEIHAHAGLPVKVPPYFWTEASDWELHAFCREHDWNVWLKGPYHEATGVKNCAEFQEERKSFTRMWSTIRIMQKSKKIGCPL